jgi:multiple sugar transport system substrate-binding protein
MGKKSIVKTQPVLIFLILVSLLLSACGTLIPTVQPVTITFGFPSSDKAYIETLLPEFKTQNPNITVTLKSYDGIQQEVTDVTTISWMTTLTDASSAQEALLPLGDFISQEKDFAAQAFYPGTLEAFSMDGKQYAIPIGVDPWVMFYNKDLFDKYSVPYPQPGWTWADFQALAEALRHPDDRAYGYVPMENYIDSLFFLYQHGGALTDSAGKTQINSPVNVEAIRWYVGLFRDTNVAPTIKQAQTEFQAARYAGMIGLLNGDIGMFMSTLSSRGGQGDYPSAWTFKWGAVPLPRDVNAFTGAYFEGLGITKQAANPDAAWKWISFLSKQPHNRLIPARTALAESATYQDLVGKDIAEVGRLAMADAMLTSRQSMGAFVNSIDIYFAVVQKVVNNDVIVQEEMDKAQLQAESR